MSDTISMRAVVLREPGVPVDVETVLLEPPRRGEVLVRVAAAGVCHSDVHLADGNLGRGRWPMVLGHEGAGVVTATGPDVTGLSPGDHVAFCFVPACGACRACRSGRRNLCVPAGAAALAGTLMDGSSRLRSPDGSIIQHGLMVACFAEHAVVPMAGAVVIPAEVPLWQAALLGCGVVTGIGAVTNAARVGIGESVCVIGCGGVGLQVIAGARLAVDELGGLLRGHVAMGVVTLSSFAELPALLADFHRDHPAVEITLSEANSAGLLEAVRTGELDLAVVGLATAPPAGIATQVVVDEPLVAAVSHSDPLATRDTLTLRALQGRPLITLPRGTGLRTCLDNACTIAGFRPQIAFEASDPVTLAELAGRGLGVAILPKSLAEFRSATLHAITIIRPKLRARLELAWRAEGPVSPAARALIARTRVAVAKPPVTQPPTR